MALTSNVSCYISEISMRKGFTNESITKNVVHQIEKIIETALCQISTFAEDFLLLEALEHSIITYVRLDR